MSKSLTLRYVKSDISTDLQLGELTKKKENAPTSGSSWSILLAKGSPFYGAEGYSHSD